jgi:hypothetical protein
MSYDSDDGEQYYAFDGMHCDYDHIISEAEEQAIEWAEAQLVETNKIELQKIKMKFATYTSGCESNIQIRNVILDRLFRGNQEYMIGRYARNEKLPFDFVIAAKQSDGINILTKSLLNRIGKIELTKSVCDSIDALVCDVYTNIKNEIIYYRVSSIRTFIYETIDEHYGKNACVQLPVEAMMNFLSACRLHLNLYDIKHRNSQYQEYQLKLNSEAYSYEMCKQEDESSLLQNSKKYMPHWKARHMKTLAYFNEPKYRQCLDQVINLNIDLGRAEYLEQIVNICTRDKIKIFSL